MKEIPLTQGKVALIDDEDWPLVKDYKWHAHKVRNVWYAETNIKVDGKRKTLKMNYLFVQPQKGYKTDHINGDGLDNRRENLRLVTEQQNQFNRHNTTGNSQYKGVSCIVPTKKWRSRITINRQIIHLGIFKNEVDAAKAYDKAAKEHFGEFAHLNFPEEQ